MDYLENFKPNEIGRAVAIGVFDGVHRGHQALLEQARLEAEESAGVARIVPTALTFDPHPSAVFAPARTPELLGTLDERVSLLRRYGMKEVVVARFDRPFAAQTPEEFVQNVLLQRLNAKVVVVGDDFRFGCNRLGDVNALQQFGERLGFAVRVVPPVFVNGTPARSTSVRQLLQGGKVEEANALLGRSYSLSGTVVHGRKLGRTIGFPTANLATAEGVLIPATGIYAATANLQSGQTVPAAVSIGTNPTVTPESRIRTVEAFLMDGFNGDLYDQPLTLRFRHYLRPMLKFDSLDALIEQMNRDVEQAAVLLKG